MVNENDYVGGEVLTGKEVTTAGPPQNTVDRYMIRVLPPGRVASVRAMLPRHVSYERFERNLYNAIVNEPKLMQCDPAAIYKEIVKVAGLGLVIDPQLGEAYLIASYKGPQIRVGYRGLIKLARQSGDVDALYAHEVRANDYIECDLGVDKRLVHKPDVFSRERGDVIGYYAVIRFKDGSSDFEPMNVDDVERIRDLSDGWKAYSAGKIKDTPWNSHFDEMAKKTVIRRLVKRSPQSPEPVRLALAVEDEAEHPEMAVRLPPERERLDLRSRLQAGRASIETIEERGNGQAVETEEQEGSAAGGERGGARELAQDNLPDAGSGDGQADQAIAIHAEPNRMVEAERGEHGGDDAAEASTANPSDTEESDVASGEGEPQHEDDVALAALDEPAEAQADEVAPTKEAEAPTKAAATPPAAAGVPEGNWTDRQRKKLSNLAKALAAATSAVTVRDAADGFIDVLRTETPEVRDAANKMVDARKAAFKSARSKL